MSIQAAPTTFADYPATNQGQNAGSDGVTSNTDFFAPFQNISVFNGIYLYSNSATYQVNPQFDIHLINHDNNSGGAQTLTLTLPKIQSFLKQRKIFIFHVRAARAGETVSFVPYDPACQINFLGAGNPYNYVTDGNPRLFICVGFYNPANANTYNQYYMFAWNALPTPVSITSSNALLTVASSGNAFTLTNNVGVSAGSGISITGSPNFSIASFIGAVGALGGATAAATTPLFFGLTAANTTEASVSPWMAPRAGVISQLYVNLSSVLAVASNTMVVVVRKNGSNQTLTCTVANGAAVANDTVNSFTVVAGDLITVSTTQTATGEAKQTSISFSFRPSSV